MAGAEQSNTFALAHYHSYTRLLFISILFMNADYCGLKKSVPTGLNINDALNIYLCVSNTLTQYICWYCVPVVLSFQM